MMSKGRPGAGGSLGRHTVPRRLTEGAELDPERSGLSAQTREAPRGGFNNSTPVKGHRQASLPFGSPFVYVSEKYCRLALKCLQSYSLPNI